MKVYKQQFKSRILSKIIWGKLPLRIQIYYLDLKFNNEMT